MAQPARHRERAGKLQPPAIQSWGSSHEVMDSTHFWRKFRGSGQWPPSRGTVSGATHGARVTRDGASLTVKPRMATRQRHDRRCPHPPVKDRNSSRRSGRQETAESHPFFQPLISSNFDSARSNLSLKSHIASRISRKVADVFALSSCPKVKMLLLRKYPIILGSDRR